MRQRATKQARVADFFLVTSENFLRREKGDDRRDRPDLDSGVWLSFSAVFNSLVTVVVTLVRWLRSWVVSDLDAITECLDCRRRFTWFEWKITCESCENQFCCECMHGRSHIIDTSGSGKPQAKAVCTFCFFTICAKLCDSSCCRGLPVREVKSFLARKGIRSQHCLEKRELFDEIHQWCLNLHYENNFSADLDLESMIRVQDAECDTDRVASPYSGIPQQSPDNDSRCCFIRSLPTSELRKRLVMLGISDEGILEKEELIRMLYDAGGNG